MANGNGNKRVADLLTAFPFGMSSGVAPLLLPKEQAAFALNTTFRGGYATDRPPIHKLSLNFPNDEIREAVRHGFFQGAGTYRPDFGNSQVVAQISGRLFTFTENGVLWDVAEITIPGDPNAATTTQVWMWQSEKWLIISDGSAKLPIFYDGVSCRRSYGPSVELVPPGDITAVAPASPPSIGGSVVLTLANPYTGPFDVPVRFNGAIYQPTGSLSGNIILTNVTAPPGANVPSGSDVVVNPTLIGHTTSNVNSTSFQNGGVACIIPISCTTTYRQQFALPMTTVGLATLGSSVIVPSSIGNLSMTVDAIAGNMMTVGRTVSSTVSPVAGTVVPPPPSMISVASGTLIQFSSSAGPIVILGQTTADFVNPTSGATVSASMNVPYSGPADQTVSIAGGFYTIAAVPAVGGTSLILINLTDTSMTPYNNPPLGPLANLDITSIPEIPACRMGAYGLGQNWVSSVDGLSFFPSDLVGSSSGTLANNYRDAVLKTTDAEVMGLFRLPVAGEIITSMTFVATLDQALGQGPLQVGVASGMFSVTAPFTLVDFQGLGVVNPVSNPILTKSLIGFGPVGQNSTVLANSDTIFRSIEGINSLILARRDFSDIGGNTPISREMSRIINFDNISLLSYSSAIVFDNRLRMTCSPQVSAQGVFHMGELVLNYDLLSSLRGKASPVWDGLWTGMNTLQYTKGQFGPIERAFAFTFNLTDGQIELYELLKQGTEHFDNGDIRIIWVVETPVIYNQPLKNLTDMVRLIDGEMYLAEVDKRVDVAVFYRPIFYPCWIPWHTFAVCADMTGTNAQEQVRYRLGFSEPDGRVCDSINNRPFRDAEAFQLRFEITGHCKLWGVKTLADVLPETTFAKPAGCVEPACLSLICVPPNDLEIYSLDGIPPRPLPPTPIPVNTVGNDSLDSCCDCS